MTQEGNARESAELIERARFTVLDENGDATDEIEVHFNPDSLEYTIRNNLRQQGNSNDRKQYVSKSSGKLSMELVFDTTLTGEDVRIFTERLQRAMEPTGAGQDRVARVVRFEWGLYKIDGIFESYKETLDFFSPTGLPLRASVHVEISQQEGVFTPSDTSGTSAVGGPLSGTGQDGTRVVNGSAGRSLTETTGADPAAARAVGASNGVERLRFAGGPLEVPNVPRLRGPLAFNTGGGAALGVGVGLGFGVSLGANLGVNASFGAGFGASVGFGAAAGLGAAAGSAVSFGLGASAGLAGASVAASGAAALGSSPGALGGSASAPSFAPNPGFATLGAPRGPVASSPAERARLIASRSEPGAPESARAAAAARFASANSAPPAFAAPVAEPGHPSSDPGVIAALPAAGGPAWGSRASANVPATLGAFAGLRAPGGGGFSIAPARAGRLRPPASARPEARLHTDAEAAFEIGGRALQQAASGFSADVGQRATLVHRVRFDEG